MIRNFSTQVFNLPPNLKPEQQVEYLTKIIINLRQELQPLRKQVAIEKKLQKGWKEKADYWQDKYQKQKDQIKNALKEMEKLRKEQEKLKKQIEKLTNTNSRYKVSLFDHGNFKTRDNVNKKPKGGQLGHIDTNRENLPEFDLSQFKRQRICAKECGHCQGLLNRVSGVKEKMLVDIVINPQVLRLIIESERQWCGNCKSEVNGKHPRSLPFSEYGLNTLMVTLILRFKAHCSMSSISQVIEIGFALKLSKPEISNLLKAAAKYLGKKYEDLKQAIRKGEVMYLDETGWQIRKQRAWMWIMASEDTLDATGELKQSGSTVYVAAESRGKGIAENIYGNSSSYAMTDGLYSYLNTIPKSHHLYCWAHVLRFAHEETANISKEKEPEKEKDSMAVFLRGELVRIYHIKFKHPEYTSTQLEVVLTKELDKLLSLSSEEESFKNIQNRIKDQKEGLIKALLFTKSGTNNLAERELRPLTIQRNISFGSNTYTGMETTAIIGSVIQTLSRRKDMPLLPNLELYLQEGIQAKYPQYNHISFNPT